MYHFGWMQLPSMGGCIFLLMLFNSFGRINILLYLCSGLPGGYFRFCGHQYGNPIVLYNKV